MTWLARVTDKTVLLPIAIHITAQPYNVGVELFLVYVTWEGLIEQ